MAIIDVVKFNGIPNRDWLVYRYPGNNFNNGTQLIVGEGQIAVFVRGGKALDYFSPGTYTLETNNIPLLNTVINIPYGGRTPFSAEIFFINNTSKMDVLWGTTDPISLIDPKYRVLLRVRTFGQFAIRITDYRVFMTQLIGALGNSQVIKYDLVIKFFKGVVVTKVKTIIAKLIIDQQTSVLEIAPYLEDISTKVKEQLYEEFERFGIEIVNFFISSINFPDEDFHVINNILGEKAAFDIIGEDHYTIQRTFDVMQTAAGNEGGNLTTAGIGLGLGAGAGIAVGNNFTNVASGAINTSANSKACQKCGSLNTKDVKFCSSCGENLVTKKTECFSCKAFVDDNVKFCPNCGSSLQKKICPNCHHENMPGVKFCCQCGTKLEG